jgi:hypothetical protein
MKEMSCYPRAAQVELTSVHQVPTLIQQREAADCSSLPLTPTPITRH